MNKIKEIDYLRALATILVILIHITANYLNYPQTSYTYNIVGSFNCALTFAVPVFLFISALLLTYQTKQKEKISWIKFIFKRIFKVLTALILWSLIYLLYWGNPQAITLKQIIGFLTLGSASYHLYFIPLIIQLYLLFPLIWLISKALSKLELNTWLSFSLATISGIILHTTFTSLIRLNIFKNFPYFAIVIFSYTLPIILGIWLGFNYDKIKNYFNKIFISILIALTFFTGYYYIEFGFKNYSYKNSLLFSPIYWSVIILALFYLLRYIKTSKVLNEISHKSFIIYLSHPLILDIVTKKTSSYPIELPFGAFINYCVNLAVNFLLILGVSYLIAFIWYSLKNHFRTKV